MPELARKKAQLPSVARPGDDGDVDCRQNSSTSVFVAAGGGRIVVSNIRPSCASSVTRSKQLRCLGFIYAAVEKPGIEEDNITKSGRIVCPNPGFFVLTQDIFEMSSEPLRNPTGDHSSSPAEHTSCARITTHDKLISIATGTSRDKDARGLADPIEMAASAMWTRLNTIPAIRHHLPSVKETVHSLEVNDDEIGINFDFASTTSAFYDSSTFHGLFTSAFRPTQRPLSSINVTIPLSSFPPTGEHPDVWAEHRAGHGPPVQNALPVKGLG
ncbi:hypothetical protein PLEOSDRAFT_166948 [Pleurotus ostreatus PC15]|uniref:Uncharacterized protein n=1 Tax=Pleurotus ostreatus (strain PC15) TaxID=1137138 RepID=A0A067NLJ9_PLEO1|nr:hypothetical protein PLEOSDRAFT_166948 [Pleurotus ostreatus PC15]